MLAKVLRYRLRRSVLIIAACLAVFGGTVIARTFGLDDARWLWLLLPCVLLSVRHHNVVTLLLLITFCFGLGWWRGDVFMHKLAVHESHHYEQVILIGKATEDAVYGERYQLEFGLTDVRVLGNNTTTLVGNITARGFGEPAIYRGDVVKVEGKLYPTRGNSLGSVSFAELDVLHRDSSWINKLRREFAAGMQSALPEPVASFGLGLLIGQRSTLPESTEEQLRHVGLTHIIAVSGYNLTIIVLACRRLLAKRSKFQATAACVALIGTFLLITGSSPPIVRASIISLLVLTASLWKGRHLK